MSFEPLSSFPFPLVFSYEPEIHPGATVRLTDKAVLKVFTTGRITLTGNFLVRATRPSGH